MTGPADVSEVAFEVLDGGLLTTIQDHGRPEWTHLGVPEGGAADRWSQAVANHLVGNAAEAAVLEMTLVGPTLQAARALTIGLAGADLGARLRGGRSLAPGRSIRLATGDIVEFPGDGASGGASGARAYLAIPGGIDVPLVLGSRSTCLAGAFGGLDGRPLRAGDRLVGGPDLVRPELAWAAATRSGPGDVLRILSVGSADLGPLTASMWQVGSASDRVGIRLDGPPLPPGSGGEVRTHGVAWGAVQVPPDGRPIVLGVDHQTTGGYRVAGVVIAADRPVLGQLGPGARVRLLETDPPAARAALVDQHDALAAGVAALRDAAGWVSLADHAGS
ncbi:MAG TPA: biotin-dependent carboxyltransferase family protein [Candidatus Limnocylindrales bacterium]|nr:biotin-dependent carboxyltransferase family protein [Candidatus Limnocylindrales bacterium]